MRVEVTTIPAGVPLQRGDLAELERVKQFEGTTIQELDVPERSWGDVTPYHLLTTPFHYYAMQYKGGVAIAVTDNRQMAEGDLSIDGHPIINGDTVLSPNEPVFTIEAQVKPEQAPQLFGMIFLKE